MWDKGQLTLVGIGMANGLSTAACVWTTHSASGAHLNPIVSLARLVTGRQSIARTFAYISIQTIGSTIASLLAMLLAPAEFQRERYGSVGRPKVDPSYSDFQVFLFEFIGSMLYVFMYFATVVDKRAPTGVFGFSLGSVLLTTAIAFGKATGACVNPVRLIGALFITGYNPDASTYLIATLSGGLFAALYYSSFILRSTSGSFEVKEDSVVNNMVNAENVNQAMNLKY